MKEFGPGSEGSMISLTGHQARGGARGVISLASLGSAMENKIASGGSRISKRGSANSQEQYTNLLFCIFLAENCMKMKEFGPHLDPLLIAL